MYGVYGFYEVKYPLPPKTISKNEYRDWMDGGALLGVRACCSIRQEFHKFIVRPNNLFHTSCKRKKIHKMVLRENDHPTMFIKYQIFRV